ncbi:MAG TPA: 30S ribosomal protein S6 [Nitrospirales bacterium]
MPQLYESIFILRSSLPDDDIPPMLEKVKATVEKTGGVVVHLSNWGKKKLAYEIKQEKKGVYVQLNYRGNGTVVAEVERLFRLDDAVLKFLTVKIEEHMLHAEPAKELEHGGVQ